MKRIRNIRDLEYEKLKLRVKQLELEKQMQSSWKRIAAGISNGNGSADKEPRDKTLKPENPLLSSVLSYGAGFLSHKVGMLAGKKVEGLAEQLMENLAVRFNAAFTKKKKG